MTSDEMLGQLRKLDELVRDADIRSIMWVDAHWDWDDDVLFTPGGVSMMIAFFEAEPTHLAAGQ